MDGICVLGFIQNYLPEDYICDTQLHNVTQCVHVEANWSGDPLKETQYVRLSMHTFTCAYAPLNSILLL